jgi:hypothetical protein
VVARDHEGVPPLLLHLNGRVENAILVTFTESVDVPDSFVAEFRPHMARHYVLAASKRPAVEIVQFFHGGEPHDVVVQALGVDVGGRRLHHNLDTVDEDGNCGQQHKDREDVGADWVCNLPLGLYLDDDGGSDDADALHHVAHDVHDSGSHVHVLANIILLGVLLVVLLNQLLSSILVKI